MLDLSRRAHRRRRALRAPLATDIDGTTPSDGPPADPTVLVTGTYDAYFRLTPQLLEKTKSGCAADLGMQALNAGSRVVGEVQMDLVWRYWKLPLQEQELFHVQNFSIWPFRHIGNLSEFAVIRVWQHTARD